MHLDKSHNIKSFVSVVLIPFIVLGGIGIGSFRWRQAGHVPGFTYNQCQGSRIRTGSAVADVVLLGSSRMGLSIDDVAVERWWPKQDINVESLMLIGSSEIQQKHALHEYFRERGVPKTLGIEVSIDRGEIGDVPAWTQYQATPWIRAVPSIETVFDVFNSLLRGEIVGWTDVFARSRVSNPLGVVLSGIQLGFDQGIRHPDQVLDPMIGCKFDYFKMFKEGWAESMPIDSALPSEGKLQSFRESANRVTDADIDSKRAIGEISLLNSMIDYAREEGVKNIFVMYFPDFDESPDVMKVEKISEKVPGVPLFDLRDVFRNGDPRTKNQYLDWRHLNSYGGWEVSKALSQFVQALGSTE
jgi:hypothetical protein